MAADGNGGRSKFAIIFTTLPGLISAAAALITALAGAGIFLATKQSSGPPTNVPSYSSFSSSSSPPSSASDRTTTPAPEPGPPKPIPGRVSISLLVGLRPQFGQLTESAELLVDGRLVATWAASMQAPSRTLSIDGLTEGRHSYELRGEYSYVNALGVPESGPVKGSGSVIISGGARYGIEYLVGQNLFRLSLLP